MAYLTSTLSICLAYLASTLSDVNFAVIPQLVVLDQKYFRSLIPGPDWLDQAKKPSHATVPLRSYGTQESVGLIKGDMI